MSLDFDLLFKGNGKASYNHHAPLSIPNYEVTLQLLQFLEKRQKLYEQDHIKCNMCHLYPLKEFIYEPKFFFKFSISRHCIC